MYKFEEKDNFWLEKKPNIKLLKEKKMITSAILFAITSQKDVM